MSKWNVDLPGEVGGWGTGGVQGAVERELYMGAGESDRERGYGGFSSWRCRRGWPKDSLLGGNTQSLACNEWKWTYIPRDHESFFLLLFPFQVKKKKRKMKKKVTLGHFLLSPVHSEITFSICIKSGKYGTRQIKTKECSGYPKAAWLGDLLAEQFLQWLIIKLKIMGFFVFFLVIHENSHSSLFEWHPKNNKGIVLLYSSIFISQ